MHLGRIIASGPPTQMWADAAVRAAYLGDAAAGPPEPRPSGCVADSGPPLLGLHGIHATRGRIPVLHGVSVSLRPGQVHAILGPNGAGKSTLVQVAGGLLRPSRGWLTLQGHRVGWVAAHALARLGVILVPERPAVFEDLSVADHLRLAQSQARPGHSADDDVLAAFPVLCERREQLAGTLSGGEQQMLALVRALAVRPVALIVDELSSGLAPNIVSMMHAKLRDFAALGSAVLLVEQFVHEALAISDFVTVMNAGREVYAGPPGEVRGELMDTYVG
jgi:branched-chain amino acid transport system ATP-binding protein